MLIASAYFGSGPKRYRSARLWRTTQYSSTRIINTAQKSLGRHEPLSYGLLPIGLEIVPGKGMQISRKREAAAAVDWTTFSPDSLRRLMSEVISLRERVAKAERKNDLCGPSPDGDPKGDRGPDLRRRVCG
jgi:hypothetical protein